MTDEESREGDEEAIEDLEAPAAAQGYVVGRAQCPKNTECHLPTAACSPDPTCTEQTFCKGTKQGCADPTCRVTAVWVQ
jgi:hypothetical protein